MMCYKGKTFCDFKDCEEWDICDRAFTKKEKENARKWWGKEGAPIAIFSDKPDCFK